MKIYDWEKENDFKEDGESFAAGIVALVFMLIAIASWAIILLMVGQTIFDR